MNERPQEKTLFQLLGIVILELVLLYLIFTYLGKIFTWIGFLLSAFLPVITGIVLAYLVNPLTKRIRSIFLVFAVIILVFGVVLTFLFPMLIRNLQDLAVNFPIYLSRISNVYFLDKVNFDIIMRLGTGLTLVASYLYSFTMGIFGGVVALFIAFYLLIKKDAILAPVKTQTQKLLGGKSYRFVSIYLKKADRIFYQFIGAQLLDAVIIGTLAVTVLFLLGNPYALALGVIIGIFNIVPLVGSIVATLLTVLVTLVISGVTPAVITLITLLILQQIDANIIGPRLTGEAVGIKPILIIFAIFVGGYYFGILGMFLGVPVIAILKLFLEDYLLFRERKNY